MGYGNRGGGGRERRAMMAFRSSLSSAVVIELRLGDVVEADLSEATRIVMFATCFPARVSEVLQYRMAEQLPDGARVFVAGSQGSWQRRIVSNSSKFGGRVLE